MVRLDPETAMVATGVLAGVPIAVHHPTKAPPRLDPHIVYEPTSRFDLNNRHMNRSWNPRFRQRSTEGYSICRPCIHRKNLRRPHHLGPNNRSAKLNNRNPPRQLEPVVDRRLLGDIGHQLQPPRSMPASKAAANAGCSSKQSTRWAYRCSVRSDMPTDFASSRSESKPIIHTQS